jgi:hypothetical protein
MALYTQHITVTVAGTAGSGAGTADGSRPLSGEVAAVYVKYTTQPATTDVTIATKGANAPAQNVLVLTNANTPGWFYPQVQIHSTAGAALTYDGTRPATEEIPVDDYITVTVAQGDPGSVDVWLVIECN